MPDAASSAAYDRYAYVKNNPINLNDPSGHMMTQGCGDGRSACSPSAKEKADYEFFRQRTDAKACQTGNKTYCSYAENHPAEVAAFGAVSIIGGAAVETFVLEGGIAATANSVAWKAGVACLKSAVCRFITSAAGGGSAAKVIGEIGQTADDFKPIDIPYGPPARQGMTTVELNARQAVIDGVSLFKMGSLGNSNVSNSQFWSLENPILNPNYANNMGIPIQNTIGARFVLEGQAISNANFITRFAPGVGINSGGGIEVVFEEFNVHIISFIMP